MSKYVVGEEFFSYLMQLSDLPLLVARYFGIIWSSLSKGEQTEAFY